MSENSIIVKQFNELNKKNRRLFYHPLLGEDTEIKGRLLEL